MLQSSELTEQLLALKRENPAPDTAVSQSLRAALLAQGSDTPDNQKAAALLEYGEVPSAWDEAVKLKGLKILDQDYLVSEVLWAAENPAVIAALGRELPDLTEAEIAAALRAATLIMGSLQRPG